MMLPMPLSKIMDIVRFEGGVGLIYNRLPKPYEKTWIWPYPNIRWGINGFAPTFDSKFQGNLPPLGPPWLAGMPNMDQLAKTADGNLNPSPAGNDAFLDFRYNSAPTDKSQ